MDPISYALSLVGAKFSFRCRRMVHMQVQVKGSGPVGVGTDAKRHVPGCWMFGASHEASSGCVHCVQ